jgi:hypothetical protein
MNLRVTDGTTTVNLDGGTAGVTGCTYFPLPGERKAASVTETARLVARGTASATVRSATTTLQRLIEQAERIRDGDAGAPVYVEYRPVSTDDYYRSRLLGGQVVWSEDPGARRIKDTNPPLQFAFVFEREVGWDGPETELQLSAASQSAATGGRTLTNGANSWATIASGQVAGDMPAALRLELTNTAGGGRAYDNLWLALNAEHDPANFTYFVEGETASGGSSESNANCSGGSARSVTVNTSATLTFTLTAANMQWTRGGRFALIGRFESLSGPGVSVRPELQVGGQTVWRAMEPWVLNRTSAQLSMLGVVPLPPQSWDATPNAAITLLLRFETSVSRTVLLDYIAFFPARNLRILTLMGQSVANNDVVVDNGIEGWAGVRSSSAIQASVMARRKPLMVRPNMTQRIYLLHSTGTGCVVADTVSLRAWYRPRRRVV